MIRFFGNIMKYLIWLLALTILHFESGDLNGWQQDDIYVVDCTDEELLEFCENQIGQMRIGDFVTVIRGDETIELAGRTPIL